MSRRHAPAPAPEQQQQVERELDQGGQELRELLKKPAAPERPRVGSIVQVVNVEPYRPVYRWLTIRHRFKVQLVDNLGPKPLLVLVEVDSRDSIAANLEDCAVVT